MYGCVQLQGVRYMCRCSPYAEEDECLPALTACIMLLAMAWLQMLLLLVLARPPWLLRAQHALLDHLGGSTLLARYVLMVSGAQQVCVGMVSRCRSAARTLAMPACWAEPLVGCSAPLNPGGRVV